MNSTASVNFGISVPATEQVFYKYLMKGIGGWMDGWMNQLCDRKDITLALQ